MIKINKTNNLITMENPKLIDYSKRDTKIKRINTTKGFTTIIQMDSKSIEVGTFDVSFEYISLFVPLKLDIKKDQKLDLGISFYIDGPSSFINEKRYAKVFATGDVVRVQNYKKGLKIIVKMAIKKAGQNIFSKYLEEREMDIIQEFKMRMKL
jgi:hypothetical protein